MKTVTPSIHTVPVGYVESIWTRIDVRGASECWPWRLSIGSHGYGQATWISETTGRSAGTTAHRIAWMAANGPIPTGMTVDHVCRNRPCCNPTHLRLLSNEENARDNGAYGKTHCTHGHIFSAENTVIRANGHRRCRECLRLRNASR